MDDRRTFLKKAAGAGVAAAGFGIWGYTFHDSENPVIKAQEIIYTIKNFAVEKSSIYPELVIVNGADPAANVRAAIEKLGGIGRFVKKGEKVVIKPNAGWDRLPEQAANTNPEVIAEIARQCVGAGAGRVSVCDVSINDAYRVFARSGLQDAAQRAGAKIVFAREADFLPCDLKGEMLGVWPVFSEFVNADRIINAPVVKHHSLCKATLSMKNWYGVLGGQRNRLHQDIHTSIADLAAAFRPTLTVIDASRILVRNGPTGGNLNDVKKTDMLIAATDEVAADAFASTLLGYAHDEIEYVRKAAARGLGSYDLANINTAMLTL